MRRISETETKFISYLLEKAGEKINIPEMVLTRKDGEMGSISFDLKGTQERETQNHSRKFL